MEKVNFIQFAIVMFIACCSFSSCNKSTRAVILESVVAPTNAQQRFGEYKVVSFTDTDSSTVKHRYEDDYISIIWHVRSTEFWFDLTNKSGHTLKINWDDISYVDYNGQVGRVMHSGVKYIERNNSQPATTIPIGASLSDILLPTENVSFIENLGWTKSELVPCNIAFNGKTLKIMLPILIEGVQNDYIFTFKIKIEKVLEETEK